MFAGFESFEGPFVVQAVRERVVDGVYSWVVDEVWGFVSVCIHFEVIIETSNSCSSLTIVSPMHNRDAVFLCICLCFLFISCRNSHNNGLSMGPCRDNQSLWAEETSEFQFMMLFIV